MPVTVTRITPRVNDHRARAAGLCNRDIVLMRADGHFRGTLDS
jgi:hypothetical protein